MHDLEFETFCGCCIPVKAVYINNNNIYKVSDWIHSVDGSSCHVRDDRWLEFIEHNLGSRINRYEVGTYVILIDGTRWASFTKESYEELYKSCDRYTFNYHDIKVEDHILYCNGRPYSVEAVFLTDDNIVDVDKWMTKRTGDEVSTIYNPVDGVTGLSVSGSPDMFPGNWVVLLGGHHWDSWSTDKYRRNTAKNLDKIPATYNYIQDSKRPDIDDLRVPITHNGCSWRSDLLMGHSLQRLNNAYNEAQKQTYDEAYEDEFFTAEYVVDASMTLAVQALNMADAWRKVIN